jgi:hypothetical protein
MLSGKAPDDWSCPSLVPQANASTAPEAVSKSFRKDESERATSGMAKEV